jgi:8-oxo-dGTP diphosphatase
MKPFYIAFAGIIANENGEILLLKRSKSSATNAGCWEPPGGKPEKGETLGTALQREIYEETGLDVVLLYPVGTGMQELSDKRVAYLIMACSVTGGAFRLSSEHQEFAWVSPGQLNKLALAPHFTPFFRRYADEAA